MGKATNFKFGRYIHRVYPNKIPLKFWEKMERGRIHGLPNFLSTPIISGTDKVTNFKFGRYIHRVYPNKNPYECMRERYKLSQWIQPELIRQFLCILR